MISLVSRSHVIGIEKDTCPIAFSEDFLSKGSVQTSGLGLVLSCASRYSYQRFKVGSDSLTPDLAGLVYVFLDFWVMFKEAPAISRQTSLQRPRLS